MVSGFHIDLLAGLSRLRWRGKPRVEYSGAFYHVICRSNRRQVMFGSESVKEIGERLHRDPSIISRLYCAYIADRDRNRETLLAKHYNNAI
jgi:hypothetical protein